MPVPARHLRRAAPSLVVCLLCTTLGLWLMATGLGIFMDGVADDSLFAMGLGLTSAGLVAGLVGLRALTETDWGEVAPAAPERTVASFHDAVRGAELPAWACVSCRLVERGHSPGACPVCGSSTDCYALDDASDQRLVLLA